MDKRQNAIVFQVRVNGCARAPAMASGEAKDIYKIRDQLILSETEATMQVMLFNGNNFSFLFQHLTLGKNTWVILSLSKDWC